MDFIRFRWSRGFYFWKRIEKGGSDCGFSVLRGALLVVVGRFVGCVYMGKGTWEGCSWTRGDEGLRTGKREGGESSE